MSAQPAFAAICADVNTATGDALTLAALLVDAGAWLAVDEVTAGDTGPGAEAGLLADEHPVRASATTTVPAIA